MFSIHIEIFDVEFIEEMFFDRFHSGDAFDELCRVNDHVRDISKPL